VRYGSESASGSASPTWVFRAWCGSCACSASSGSSVACSGADAFALCAGAILAYPAVWRMRLAGVAGGIGAAESRHGVSLEGAARRPLTPDLELYYFAGVCRTGRRSCFAAGVDHEGVVDLDGVDDASSPRRPVGFGQVMCHRFLPSTLLGCPAWFAADAPVLIARALGRPSVPSGFTPLTDPSTACGRGRGPSA